ncbi:heterokaryon incompatibility protein [Rutstroemia sp. NJR-2017a BVV2]|nr:heterokaryon incompatibility protein [Rutstroemia sp. NJR-2017a BVV2]
MFRFADEIIDLPCPLPLPEKPDTATQADSQQCLRYARTWLNVCQMDHIDCSLPGHIVQLPTRVLDITRTEPRLFVSDRQTGSYAALSYCWGTEGNLITRRDDLESFRAQIPSVNIPATIKDAIQVAKSLGFQYLWVDALCIIQDDPEDWEIESCLMAQVYGNADLVIAASSAKNSQQGFLTQTRRHPQGSVYFYNKGDPSKPYCIKYGLGPSYQMTLDEGPLAKRAWAYQEKILARRYLCYGPEELSWHCNAIETCECSYVLVLLGGVQQKITR